MVLATWEASSNGNSVIGVSGSPDEAKAQVRAWMRSHGGEPSGRVEAVRLALEATSLLTRYERTGAAWRAKKRSDGRVVFVPDGLTVREREVAELAATGIPACEIASQLGISKRTADSHLAHIHAKSATGGTTGRVAQKLRQAIRLNREAAS